MYFCSAYQKHLGAGRRNTYHVEIGKSTHRRPIDGAGFDGFDPHVVS